MSISNNQEPTDQFTDLAKSYAASRPPLATHRSGFARFASPDRLRSWALVPVIGVLMVIGTLVDPVFLSPENLVNVLQQQTELALVVLALSLTLIAGKIDLSLESTVGFAPALAVTMVAGLGIGDVLVVPLALAIGAVVGAVNGLLIMRLGLNAFIVTLGMLIVLRGLQIGITGGQSIFDLPESISVLGGNSFIGLPISIWICVAAFAVGIVVLHYFRHGRAVYAVGGNAEAARAAGVRTDRTVWVVFVLGSVLAALAGVLFAGRLGSIAASQGQGMIFTVFAAAVIGGISLAGGRGSLFGALTGVIALGLIQNILTLAGISGEWFGAIYGAIILAALMISRLTAGKEPD
jgi:ribose/xylose/arabinose/galactoside ABC-type transport system permease subunit